MSYVEEEERDVRVLYFKRNDYSLLKLNNFAYKYVILITTIGNKNHDKM